MGALSGEYPRSLAKVIRHAKRLTKVLASLEAHETDVWFLGRAGELRGVVSLALGDFRSGACDAESASLAIVSYVDTLHRGIAKKLHCGFGLDCCHLDEVITAGVPEEWNHLPAADSESTEPLPPTQGPTVPAGWVESPSVVARVREGLPLVDRSAGAMARRVGEAQATLDDLRAFGREGLLDAARSFDKRRGVPFERWASLRIRNAMIDGVRRWGPVPAGARRRQEDLDASRSSCTRGPSERHAPSDASDSEPLAPLSSPPHAVGDDLSPLSATPETLLERAQIAVLVREVVARLPKRERALIERSYFQGLTPEQAAASIGLSRSWGHQVHARAIARLQRDLRKRDRTAVGGGNGWTSKRP